MKIVQVTYTAKPAFVQQNSENIRAVMNELKVSGHPGILYHSCLGADGKTFTHTAFYAAETDQEVLTNLSSFQHFQKELKALGLEIPPKQELLTLVGISREIFK